MIQASHIALNPTVGVAPGTTTMTMNGTVQGLGDCPPDEMIPYVLPPQVTEGNPPGVAPSVTSPGQYYNPYQDMPSLRGARGLGDYMTDLGNANWAVVGFFGVAAFAIGLGVFFWRGRKKS